MDDLLKTALENEYKEAKMIVDSKLNEGDKCCFYKMYTIGKVLMEFLADQAKHNNKTAEKVNEYLETMADYYNKQEGKEC